MIGILERAAMILLMVLLSTRVAAKPCRVRLVIQPPTPKGTPVYSKPDGPLLLTTPKATDSFKAVRVIGYKKGWWEIDTTLLEPAPKVTIKEGWVRVSHTLFTLGDMETGRMTGRRYSTPIYTGPTYAKKSGVRVHMDAKVEFIGCHGPWVKISHRYKGKHTLGWWAPEDQCPNTVTNCHKSEEGEKTGVDSDGNR